MIKWIKVIGITFCCSVVFVLFIPALLFYSKPVDYADLMIVLSGDSGSRCQYAISLYQKGISKKMLMTGGESYDTSYGMIMKNYAVKRGVPSRNILVESAATSTYENADFSLDLIQKKRMEGNEIASVVVVTSGFHSYRSYCVFRAVFPDDIDVYMMPSDDDGKYIDWLWWRSSRLLEDYGIEFFKLIFYYLSYL